MSGQKCVSPSLEIEIKQEWLQLECCLKKKLLNLEYFLCMFSHKNHNNFPLFDSELFFCTSSVPNINVLVGKPETLFSWQPAIMGSKTSQGDFSLNLLICQFLRLHLFSHYACPHCLKSSWDLQTFIHLFIFQSFIFAFIHSFIHSLIHSFIH